MRFSELLQEIQVVNTGGDLQAELLGIAYDSRQVKPGFLFVAIKGFNTDGHRYLWQAVKQGAVAVVIERQTDLPDGVAWAQVADGRQALALLSARFYDNPSQKLQLVGITGTNGKTTIANLIAAVCETADKKVGLLGTIHNRIGGRIIQGSHTTPESKDLQGLFQEMVDAGTDTCVMEVSSHALALHRVTGCEFDLAVFTNLTRDHLDLHGTPENYLAAKLKLFQELKTPGGKGNLKRAVINADDRQSASFIEAVQSAGGMAVTYGIKKTADVYADRIVVKSKGVRFTVRGNLGVCRLRLHLTGRFNVYNALAAFTAGVLMGIPIEVIKEALEGVPGVHGRFATVNAGQDFTVVVDYAHTPDGLENTLQTARQLTNKRLITVYGCGGDRDRGKRPIMGQIAAKYSDFQVITSDNPRSEDQCDITNDILEGVRRIAKPEAYLVEEDRRRAIGLAINMAQTGDVVVIAGKGHEDYQLIGGETLPFDDTVEATEAIRRLVGG